MGGHRRFQPSVLARELASFGVTNVGAAGTFVVRGKVSRASLKGEILRRLPFEAEVMICPARDIIGLARGDAFENEPAGETVRRFVSVMDKPLRTLPSLPVSQPAGGGWEVKVVGVSGRYALSLHRPMGHRIYPNAVVEKAFGVSATTRNWNTIATICDILQRSS